MIDHRVRQGFCLAVLWLFPHCLLAEDAAPTVTGTIPFTSEPDTHQRPPDRIFPLFKKQLVKDPNRELPPPFGVMVITNWMNSDWRFESAQVNLNGSNPITIDAASNA